MDQGVTLTSLTAGLSAVKKVTAILTALSENDGTFVGSYVKMTAFLTALPYYIKYRGFQGRLPPDRSIFSTQSNKVRIWHTTRVTYRTGG